MMNSKLQSSVHQMRDEKKTTKRLNLYTSAQAALKLGVAQNSVRRYVKDGLLDEVKIASGDMILIDGESVDKLAKQFELNPPRRGRKPKAN